MSTPFHLVITLPEGDPSPAFLEVGNVSIVGRMAIVAKRAGASQVSIVGADADVERARGLLRNEPRIGEVPVAFGAVAEVDSTTRRIDAEANVIVPARVFSLLADSAEPTFVPGAPSIRVDGDDDPVPLWEGEPPEGCFVTEVHGPSDLRRARRVVMHHARSAGSSPVARHLHERGSQPLSRLLAETPVTANMITFLNTFLGLLAAWLWTLGDLAAFAAGGMLMQVTSVLDCVDGELARGKLLESKWGAWFDTVGDHVVNFAWVLGLAIGYGRFAEGRDVPWAHLIPTLSLAEVVLSFTLIAGLFLFLLSKKAGTKLKDVATTIRTEGERGALFRLLDKLYVLGRRASIALAFTIFSVLPWLTGLVIFYDALFVITGIFLVVANLYYLLGAIGTTVRSVQA